ncbi:DUF805 domain-containing protein [Ligilactobacillus aviarius]|uniref:DUF805 domain-containing protein n=1 Tax=Ligilactobacillus aviarius TaxID=1606 RepID=UPI0024BA0689|nr:DUF805 domain-containing protein [Ligilactobacillus aviarius]
MKLKQVNETQDVTLKDSLLNFWKGSISYNGRSVRKSFWIGIVEYLAIMIVIDQLVLGYFASVYAGGASGIVVLVVRAIFLLAMLIPLTALAFRRLRDAGLKTLPITILVIINAVLAVLNVLFTSTIAVAALVVCQAFLILLFCIPTDAMAVDKETKVFREK